MLAAAGVLVLVALVLIVAHGHSGARAGHSAALGANGATPSRSLGASAPYPVGQLAAPVDQPSVDAVLRYTSYLALAGDRRRDLALTFDDGPGPYTAAILRVLRATHTPATFFVIGRWARRYPRLVAAEARGGFEIGDHTETHPFMPELSPTEQEAQIADAANNIVRAGGPYPRLWRPPYGAFNPATLAILRAERMLMVLWSVDTSDYIRPGVSKIVYTAVSGARPGAVILMHDGGGNRSETVAALPRIIKLLRARGYRLVTIAQLLADDPPPRGQPPPHPLSGI